MRCGHVRDARQIVHEVVDRLETACGGIPQHNVEPALLGLSCVEEAAHIERALHVWLNAGEHCQRAGDVEPANADRDVLLPKPGGDVEGARKLVRLDADQHHKALIGRLDLPGDLVRADAGVGLVNGDNVEVDIGTKDLPLAAIPREPVKARQRIGRDWGAEPLDDVAIIIIVGRLDQDQPEQLPAPVCSHVLTLSP